jgi:CP family cyanate transporter-like MFS transporter
MRAPRSRKSGPAGSVGTVGARHGLLLVAVLIYALSLRGPIVALAPVLVDVRRGLHIGSGGAGLLTSLPVACFALAAPLAAVLLARVGIERAISVSLLGILIGTLVRSAGGFPAAAGGTLLIGASITIGNVAIPVLIGRDFTERVGLVTAMYTAALNVGSMITSALTAPLAQAVGWRAALATWAVLVVVAGLLWAPASRALRSEHAQPVTPTARAASKAESGGPPVWARPFAWGLTLAFAGQAFSYYGIAAWLPTLLRDERGLGTGVAGVSASIFQILAVVGALGVPILIARGASARAVLLVICAFWASLPIGLIVAPGLWPLWCVSGGIAQGGGITVIFTVIVLRTTGMDDARRLSAMVQGGGYSIAALGPLALGTAHQLSGGWNTPMAVVIGAIAVMTAAGALSVRSGSARSG